MQVSTKNVSIRPSVGLLPRYRVLLHDDDINTMDHVVRTLLRAVPGMSGPQAHGIMLEAHEQGLAVVIICPLEPAELYRDGLRSGGLIATIEPV